LKTNKSQSFCGARVGKGKKMAANMARRILYFFVIQYALRGDLPPFSCVRLAMRCEWVGCRVGKQKNNRLDAVVLLRALAQGRHMALTTWTATGYIFQYVFFK